MDQDFSDSNTQLSPDGCWLVFVRGRPNQPHVLMMSNRGSNGDFDPPQPLQTNATTDDEQHPWLSPDGRHLYYAVGTMIYVAMRG